MGGLRTSLWFLKKGMVIGMDHRGKNRKSKEKWVMCKKIKGKQLAE